MNKVKVIDFERPQLRISNGRFYADSGSAETVAELAMRLFQNFALDKNRRVIISASVTARSILKLFLLCLFLSGCGGHSLLKPAAIVDAESTIQEGLKAFSEANWQRSQQLFAKALLLYQGLDDQQGVLLSQINLAEVAMVLKDYTATQQHLQIANEMAKKTAQVALQARIALLSSQYALAQNQLALAKQSLQSLIVPFEGEVAVKSASHIQLVAIANRTKIAFVENKQTVLWTHRFANALYLSDSNDVKLSARLLRFQAVLLQQQGKIRVSESNLQQALVLYKKSFFRPGIAVTLTEVGQLYRADGRWSDAKAYFKRARAVYHFLKNTEKVSHLTKLLLNVEGQMSVVQPVK